MESGKGRLVLGFMIVSMLVLLAGVSVVGVIVFNRSFDETDETYLPVSELQPGMVVRGGNGDMFYLAPNFTRRHIADRDVLSAFGFSEQEVVAVSNDTLSTIPLMGEMTRLVYFEPNLYWVMDGQRWLVNEWRDVVVQADYTGVGVTPLDNWLQHHLPVRLNFERGMLLSSGQSAVYYFDFDSIVPVNAKLYAQTRVNDVPDGVLSVYPTKTRLEKVDVALVPRTSGINVYRGPGTHFDVMGTVAHQATVEQRHDDWVKVSYQGETGWIPAETIINEVALNLLPVSVDDRVEIAVYPAE